MAEHTDGSFYVTGGTLRHDAACYVERQADKDLLDGLLKGEFCYVLTSRQMGKSSLMVRTAGKLREQGIQVAVLDLTAIGQNLTPEQWYDGLMLRVGRQLKLEDELEDFWEANRQLGPCQRFFTALRDVALPGKLTESELVVDRPNGSGLSAINSACINNLVIFVDELDVVRSLPFSTDEFFAAIRECYTRRTEDPEFNRLTFCLLGVATPSDLIRDTRITPFNIGRRIELSDFTAAEASPLANGLLAPSTLNPQLPTALLERILYWTNGHPYLTQRLCRAVAERSSRGEEAHSEGMRDQSLLTSAATQMIDQLCEGLFFSTRAREQDDNLLFVRERLLRAEADRASLLTLYQQVIARKRVPDDETSPFVAGLRLCGITRPHTGTLAVRNRIYECVFDKRWIAVNMPDAEVRRQKTAFRRGLLGASAIALAVVSSLTGVLLYAQSQARTAQRYLYASDMNLAAQAWEAGHLLRARELLDRHRPASASVSTLNSQSSSDLRGFEWRLLWELAHEDHARLSFDAGTNGVTCLSLSANGKHLAWSGADGVLRTLDTETGQASVLSSDMERVNKLAFSPNHRWLAAGCANGTVKLWELGSWRERKSLSRHAANVSYLAFDPSGTQLISGSDDRTIRLWDLASPGKFEELTNPENGSNYSISPDATMLAGYGGLNNTVRFWKLGSKAQRLPDLPPQKGIILAVAFSPDSRTAIISAHDSLVLRWDLPSLKPLVTYYQKVLVRHLALSTDGKTLATAGSDNLVKVWDAESGHELRTLRGHTSEISQLAISADGKTLVSVSLDNRVKVWPIAANEEKNLLPHSGIVVYAAVSPDGRTLATSDPNFFTVRLWDLASRRSTSFLTNDKANLTFSSDGKWFALARFSGAIEFWNCTAWPYREGPTIVSGFAVGNHLSFSPDGKIFAFRGTNNTVVLWDVAGQRLIGHLPNHTTPYCATAFSRDGEIIATGSDKQIRFWEIKSQRLLAAFDGQHSDIRSLSFSPDGRLLAAASGDTEVRLWDVSDRTRPRPLLPLKGHTAFVAAVAFSPDGKTLATGSFDSTLKLWNLALGQEIATLRGHSAVVQSLAWSPDGQTIFTGSGDATVRIWHAPSFAEIEILAKAEAISK